MKGVLVKQAINALLMFFFMLVLMFALSALFSTPAEAVPVIHAQPTEDVAGQHETISTIAWWSTGVIGVGLLLLVLTTLNRKKDSE